MACVEQDGLQAEWILSYAAQLDFQSEVHLKHRCKMQRDISFKMRWMPHALVSRAFDKHLLPMVPEDGPLHFRVGMGLSQKLQCGLAAISACQTCKPARHKYSDSAQSGLGVIQNSPKKEKRR